VARTKKILAPTYKELIVPTYKALLELGGSGNNDEICEQIINDLQLSDEIVDESNVTYM
jgi:restriction system protein